MYRIPNCNQTQTVSLAELFTIPPKEQCQIQERYCDVKGFQCHGHWDYFAQTDHYSSSLALTSTLLEVIVSSSWTLGKVLHRKPLWMHNNPCIIIFPSLTPNFISPLESPLTFSGIINHFLLWNPQNISHVTWSLHLSNCLIIAWVPVPTWLWARWGRRPGLESKVGSQCFTQIDPYLQQDPLLLCRAVSAYTYTSFHRFSASSDHPSRLRW